MNCISHMKRILKAQTTCLPAATVIIAIWLGAGVCYAEDLSGSDARRIEENSPGAEEMVAFDRRFNFEGDNNKIPFDVTLHRPNYFLPFTYNDNPNAETYEQADRSVPNEYEAKFQLSLKMLIWKDIFRNNGDLYGAYTQLSLWQIYDESSPFRETNYEPELFLKFDTDIGFLGLRNRLLLIGINHQSNGQSGSFSRSWNRIYVEFIATKGNFVIGLKPWYRIPENEADDDNPDIYKYLGYGQLWGAYKWGRSVFSFTLRNNLRPSDNKGGIELGWSFGLTDNLRFYLQYFNGYGESLIDYDNATNRIGAGVMINDWL